MILEKSGQDTDEVTQMNEPIYWEVTQRHQGEDGVLLGLELQDPDGYFDANVRYDGLLELHVYHNVPKGEKNPAGDGHVDTLHLGDLDGFIRRLQELKSVCRDLIGPQHFGGTDDDPEVGGTEGGGAPAE